jgi:hypothetical protein
VTHPILPLATDETCQWEIQASYDRLRQETDACVPVLCYPAGKAAQRELEAARRAGLRAAVTSTPGYAATPRGPDPTPLRRFALPRFSCPHDRPHLVTTVAGLVHLKWKVQGWRPRSGPWAREG